MSERKKIVLLEDEKTLGEILTHKLHSDGYETHWELNGASGLRKIQEVRPDLILLDIVMPKMDGYEVLERLSEDAELKKIPVIVISNSGQPVEIERIVALGAKDYIVKAQFSPEEVLAKIKKYISGSTEPELSVATAKKKGIRILIIEDDPFLSSLARGRLLKEGYDVAVATDGEQGLRALGETIPDLVLLDIIMPVLDGFEVLRRMKADPRLKDVPVVIFSNLGQEHEVEEGKRLGADDFLVKAKLTLREVMAKIEALLQKRGKL